MPLKNVRWEPDEESFRIEGGGELFFDDGCLVVPLDRAGDVSLAHLTRALRHYVEGYGGDVEWIVFVENDHWEPPAFQSAYAIGEFNRGRVTIEVAVDSDVDELRAPEMSRLVSPLLAQHDALWGNTWINEDSGYIFGRMLSATLGGSRRSLKELADLGVELQNFCSALSGGEFNAAAARNLVAAGRINLLLGQSEGPWLDAKGAPYKLGSDSEKWELAKDVASFANAGDDSMILLGATTRRTSNGDVLDTVRPFDLKSMDVPAIRAILRDRIVPLIADLDVGVIEVRSGYGYGWIRIPRQAEELRPFLVAGALAGSGYVGTHVSIPFRAMEDTVHLDAAAVHSLIAAGRASLRNVS